MGMGMGVSFQHPMDMDMGMAVIFENGYNTGIAQSAMNPPHYHS